MTEVEVRSKHQHFKQLTKASDLQFMVRKCGREVISNAVAASGNNCIPERWIRREAELPRLGSQAGETVKVFVLEQKQKHSPRVDGHHAPLRNDFGPYAYTVDCLLANPYRFNQFYSASFENIKPFVYRYLQS